MVRTFAELPQADEQIKDRIMHLRLKAAGQVFFMSDSVREPVQRGNGMAYSVSCLPTRGITFKQSPVSCLPAVWKTAPPKGGFFLLSGSGRACHICPIPQIYIQYPKKWKKWG